MTEGTRIDLEKMRSIGSISQLSGPTVREGRRSDGVRVKATTDELGHTVTEHATRDDRVDVRLRAPAPPVFHRPKETDHA